MKLLPRLLRRIGALAALLAATAAAPAFASTSGIVISQVYGGNGATYARDYVELFNGGSAPVSLAGWSVQYASATGTGNFSANGVVALSGTLQPGQYFLVGLATSASGSALPATDASGALNLSSTGGKVIVANVSTGLACNGGSTACSAAQLAQIVDLVGYGSANFFEGAAAAPAPSSTLALLRSGAGCADTGSNAADFAAGTPAPRNSATPPSPCGVQNQPIVASCPAAPTVGAGFTVGLPVSATDADDAVGSAQIVSGAVSGITLDGFTAAGGAGGSASATLQVANGVAAGNYPLTLRFGNGRGQTTDCAVALTVSPVGPFTAVPAIQGSGTTSPLVGQALATRGVVTRVNSNGFFVQDPVGDGDPATSDALFVFTGAAPMVAAGQLVQVSGTVVEFNVGSATNPVTVGNPLTELSSVSATVLLGSGSVVPTVVTLPEATPGAWERYEGMLLDIQTPLTVSQNYFQGRYGQVTVSALGRLVKPTQLHRPGTPEALSLATQNAAASLLLDDGASTQNPNPIPYIGADHTLRAGDTLPGLTGVLDFGLATNSADGIADWRLHPTVAPVITRANARSTLPPAVGGNLKVASFNVLNYFTTFGDGTTAGGQSGQGCAPSGTTADCRGADNAAEFVRQRAKIVAAIQALDADVVGLMEIQNNGDTAAQNLVDALNAATAPGTWAVVPAPSFTGTDAIRVAMIHRPARVSRLGGALSDADPVHNRPPMAQTFQLLANGERFSVVVNHFKSKSCNDAAGAELDQGDGQGCYNARRTAQAQRLLSFIAQVQAAAADDDVLVIGDLNAYGLEDPIFALTSAGLVDQARRFAAAPYSYVFDGEAGTLDHGLASTTLSSRVVGAAHWKINADEPSVIDYNTEFKPQDLYSATPYRSSDHDPLLVGIDLQGPQAQTIRFDPLADQATGAPAVALVASASSGLPVVFSTLTLGVCSISGVTVLPLAVGTCTVAANQAGDAAWLPATQVTRSFSIRSAQTIQFAPPPTTALATGSVTLGATASSGLAVSYVSQTPAVCSTGGSTVTLLAQGTCTVTAEQAGNASFAAAPPVTVSFEVVAVLAADEGDVPLPAWAVALLAAGLAGALRRRAGR
jgi:uncharacterized protein